MIEQLPEKFVLDFLNSIYKKDNGLFQSSFLFTEKFLDVLPGGLKVANAEELYAMHKGFMSSKLTKFQPLESFDPNVGFAAKHLIDPILDKNFFYVGIDAHVVKPRDLRTESADDLVTNNMHLAILALYNEVQKRWYVRSIRNTVIER